jgi:hypothetical protein
MPKKYKSPEELQAKSVAKYKPEEHISTEYVHDRGQQIQQLLRRTIGRKRASTLTVPKWVNVGYDKEGKPVKAMVGRQPIAEIHKREPELGKNYQEVYDSAEALEAGTMAGSKAGNEALSKGADARSAQNVALKAGVIARVGYATEKTQKRGLFGKKWAPGPTEVSTVREEASQARAIRKGAGAISAFLSKRKYNRSPNWFATRKTQSGGYRNPRQYSTYSRTQRVVNPGSYGTTKFEVGSPRNIQQMVNFVERRPIQPVMNMAGVRQSVSDVIDRPTNQYRDVKVSSFKSADELLSFGPKKRVAPPLQIQQSNVSSYSGTQQQPTGLEFMKRRKIKWY